MDGRLVRLCLGPALPWRPPAQRPDGRDDTAPLSPPYVHLPPPSGSPVPQRTSSGEHFVGLVLQIFGAGVDCFTRSAGAMGVHCPLGAPVGPGPLCSAAEETFAALILSFLSQFVALRSFVLLSPNSLLFLLSCSSQFRG